MRSWIDERFEQMVETIESIRGPRTKVNLALYRDCFKLTSAVNSLCGRLHA